MNLSIGDEFWKTVMWTYAAFLIFCMRTSDRTHVGNTLFESMRKIFFCLIDSNSKEEISS